MQESIYGGLDVGRGKWFGDAGLVGDFIVAGIAAGLAVKEAVLAEADLHLRLAEAAVALALAAVFGHFALHAAVLVFGCAGGGHGGKFSSGAAAGKVPLVTGWQRRSKP
jgi:hypothetical protein